MALPAWVAPGAAPVRWAVISAGLLKLCAQTTPGPLALAAQLLGAVEAGAGPGAGAGGRPGAGAAGGLGAADDTGPGAGAAGAAAALASALAAVLAPPHATRLPALASANIREMSALRSASTIV